MSRMKGVEAGFDLYFHHKGHRVLDEALYFILQNLRDENIDHEFLGSWGGSLYSKKLELLGDLLEERICLEGEEGIPDCLLELMENFQREKNGVERYLRYGRPPALTVDGVVFREGKLLLIRRKNEPFQGMHALPGGFVDYGERTEDAVVREVREETGLETSVKELVGVYSDPDRDPRGHTVSAIYLLEITGGELREGDDAAAVEYVDPDKLPPLAFDHETVVKDAMKMK